MSFDVHLIASTASPPPGVFEARIDAALKALVAEGSVAEEGFITRDGLGAELYAEGGGGVMFALRDFSPSLAEVIFAVAEATACFILPSTEVLTPLRTPSNTGDPVAGELAEVDELLPPVPIADAQALMAVMNDGFETWERFLESIPTTPKPKKLGWFARLFSRS